MCEKIKYGTFRIDPCLIPELKKLWYQGIKTILSCWGHGVYPKTILIRKEDNTVYDFVSGMKVGKYNPKKKKQYNRFYKKDVEGYYYIP